MKLLFEGYTYKKEFLRGYFGDIADRVMRNAKGDSANLDAVGYYFNTKSKEPIFLLPKVFLFDNKGFGFLYLSQESALDLTQVEISNLIVDYGWQEKIIYDLPFWLYRAMAKYRKKDKTKDIELENYISSLITPKASKGESSLLDIVLALEEFYKKNKDLFIMIYKQSHKGYNKVVWTKTVRKSIPIHQGSNIIYPLVINKRKEIDFDEELLCIFFNTLRYIAHKYISDLKVESLYNLMPDAEFFRKTEAGIIARQLHSIKGNYFSDKLQTLWKLLYAFHKEYQDLSTNRFNEDYLLTKNFNDVFEDMIDELLTDDDIPNDLINQQDGKVVDHMFVHDSLLPIKKDIYYVSDSKYYKDGAIPEGPARYKQYTYAKNILQAQFNWYHAKKSNKRTDYTHYRDDVTEGYNITPNFFISGNATNDSLYKEDDVCKILSPFYKANKELNEYKNRFFQFDNRLFDRDTLFLRQYEINFMFVLYSYTAYSKAKKEGFRNDAKAYFRNDFLEGINAQYNFYVARPKVGVDIQNYLDQNFRLLIGKVFCPYPISDDSLIPKLMIIALENSDREKDVNNKVLVKLSFDYWLYDYRLGEDILEANTLLEICKKDIPFKTMVSDNKNYVYKTDDLTEIPRSSVVIGCFKNAEHFEWIKKHNSYNVRWDIGAKGSVQREDLCFSVNYLILYNVSDHKDIYLFKLKHTDEKNILDKTDSIFGDYPSPTADQYLVYEIDQEMSIDHIDEKLLEEKLQYNAIEGAPIYASMGSVWR